MWEGIYSVILMACHPTGALPGTKDKRWAGTGSCFGSGFAHPRECWEHPGTTSPSGHPRPLASCVLARGSHGSKHFEIVGFSVKHPKNCSVGVIHSTLWEWIWFGEQGRVLGNHICVQLLNSRNWFSKCSLSKLLEKSSNNIIFGTYHWTSKVTTLKVVCPKTR